MAKFPETLATCTPEYIIQCVNSISPDNDLDIDTEIDDKLGDLLGYSCGYPQEPYLLAISQTLDQWITEKRFPIRFQPMKDLEEDVQYYNSLDSLTPLVLLLEEEGDKCEILEQIVQKLGIRGLLTLLTVRKTVGSIDYFPPIRSELYKAFNQIHGGDLTVGARALTKHCHRSITDKWWGTIKGSSSGKNNQANKILKKILSKCTFINCHLLPHNIPCIEVRSFEGYGARWLFTRGNPSLSANAGLTSTQNNFVIFRGFLEPHSIDGHERGWRH